MGPIAGATCLWAPGLMRRCSMTDRVGQQFGNYRLVSLLGQGGYAEVYLGQHVRLELQAAIKVLHTYLTGSEAEHFYQEAQTTAMSSRRICSWGGSRRSCSVILGWRRWCTVPVR